MRRPARLSLLITALSTLACASSAWGYVRKKTDGGLDQYWQVTCIPLAVYMNGYNGMTRDEVAKSIGAAANTWSPSAVTCADGSHPFLEIVASMTADGAAPPAAGYDGRNTLSFYTPAHPYPANSGLSSVVIASTQTWARADGHVVDADVRINAFDHTFANVDTGYVLPDGVTPPYDLQNALTHEFGHLIGLGHSCWNPFSDEEPPIDYQGMPVVSCDSAPLEVQQTVMFATITLNDEIETTKRTLSPDDILAVCSIYPSSQDPRACTYDTPNDGCGCRATDVSTARPIVLLAIAFVLVHQRRRRRTTGAR